MADDLHMLTYLTSIKGVTGTYPFFLSVKTLDCCIFVFAFQGLTSEEQSHQGVGRGNARGSKT